MSRMSKVIAIAVLVRVCAFLAILGGVEAAVEKSLLGICVCSFFAGALWEISEEASVEIDRERL